MRSLLTPASRRFRDVDMILSNERKLAGSDQGKTGAFLPTLSSLG